MSAKAVIYAMQMGVGNRIITEVHSVSPALDTEAIRVLKAMPE